MLSVIVEIAWGSKGRRLLYFVLYIFLLTYSALDYFWWALALSSDCDDGNHDQTDQADHRVNREDQENSLLI